MTKQLSVATLYSSNVEKRQKILDYLKLHPEGATPKMISFSTRLNHNTVKTLLPRMSELKRVTHGWYTVVFRGDGGTHISQVTTPLSWNFHNCILSSVLSDSIHPVTTTHKFGLIDLELTVSKTHQATLRVATDYPLNVSSLSLVFGFFKQLFPGEQITESNTFIQTLEFNKDFHSLKLEGIKCISISSLCEQFKLYHKKLGTRIEHKTKVKLGVSDVMDMLTNNPNSLELNIKLNDQARSLSRLTEATRQNTELITQLIRTMKG